MRTYSRKKKAQGGVNNRKHHLLRKYGLTLEQYDEMFVAQSGLCALCGLPETVIDVRKGTISNLAVDHDYKTGAIRALLCRRCNVGIGKFEDDAAFLRRAADYLDRYC